MKLSVIIVNYNVKAYLQQCLLTVQRAMKEVDGDIFVVDNLSTDGSVEMVREKFPKVKLIANKENAGFSRANNQAIDLSTSEYVVLLNPDTVVGEDVFQKVISFMDEHPNAGGLGVKMIDGRGRFLPESKRGLPTPAVAFYKIVGLARLFPRSKVFGRYHLGHLPEDEIASIEILSGACMFLRKSVLDEVGTLDESFFMYGEDIDLSYRILQGGYENYYYPPARIIHYKGESTKKSSINYVFVFYNAMAIFAKKHFTKKRADVFASLINGSIFLSAAAAIVARFLYRLILPITDVLIGTTLALALHAQGLLPTGNLTTAIGTMLAIWGISGLSGIFDEPVKLSKCFIGAAFGTLIVIGATKLLLPDPLTLLQGTLLGTLALVTMLLSRILLHSLKVSGYNIRDNYAQRVLAVGSNKEASKAAALIWQTHYGLGEVHMFHPTSGSMANEDLTKIIKKLRADEVIFCAGDLPAQQIIALMGKMDRSRAQFKIAHSEAGFVIGPSSIESLEDLYILDRNSVKSSAGRRSKRLIDIIISLGLLLTLPFIIWAVENKGGLLQNLWEVLSGKRTWVGYSAGSQRILRLPKLHSSVLRPTTSARNILSGKALRRMELAYAKNYHPLSDVRTVWHRLSQLGDR